MSDFMKKSYFSIKNSYLKSIPSNSPTTETRNAYITRDNFKYLYTVFHIILRCFILMCQAIEGESRSDGRQKTDRIGYVMVYYETSVMFYK